MIFSSAIFLFGFLPVFLLGYYLTPKPLKNLVALVGSYLFYAWGAPVFAVVLLGSSFVDYLLGLYLVRHGEEDQFKRKCVVAMSVTINIGTLLYAKYSNFFMEQLNVTQGWLGHDPLSWEHIALPIGISFFTFQKLSYMIDVYRGHVRPANNFVSFALYVALFPQLIAGPIIRYHDLAEQLVARVHSSRKFAEGLYRFSIGLGKKVLIADAMAHIADTIFGYYLDHLPMHYAWIGIFAYSMQIYFDFSGYSDMAIGLGKMMGFDYLENFNRPYVSRNFTEFWRRWHISLSNWMKEYLYIPLGGNRVSPFRQYANLWIVFLLSGFWHGASWNFIIWGAFHGFFLTLDKIFKPWKWAMVPNWASQLVTFFLISLSWVFFRMETLDQSLKYIGRLFDFGSWGQVYEFPVNAERYLGYFLSEIINNRTLFIIVLAAVIAFVPDENRWLVKWRKWLGSSAWAPYYKGLVATALLFLAVIDVANMGYHPFIYFRF